MATAISLFDPNGFYFWGHIKSLICSAPIATVEELQHRILEDFDIIKWILKIWETICEN